jgi:hypothetical protein
MLWALKYYLPKIPYFTFGKKEYAVFNSTEGRYHTYLLAKQELEELVEILNEETRDHYQAA